MTRPILRLLYVGIIFSLLTACITPPALPVETNPAGVATPTVAQLANFDQQLWDATSPDNGWQVKGLTALPQANGEQYYTEMRVKKVDGSAEWVPVATWSHFGLGYTTPQPLHWSPDGRYLYFTNAPVPDGCGLFVNASDLQRLNLADGTVTEVLPYGLTWSLAIAPNGETVAYNKGDELYLLDLASSTVTTTKVEGLEPNAMWGNFVWSPDSQQLTFTVAYAPCQPPAWSHSIVVVDIQRMTMTKVVEKDIPTLVSTEHCTVTDLTACQPAPNGQWTAEINGSQGTLLHHHTTGTSQTLFPASDTINALSWSPDSHTLIAVRDQRHTNSAGEVQVDGLPQLWQVTVTATQATSPTLVFDTTQTVPHLQDTGPGQLVLGDWSPDNQHLLFWVGPLGASIQADGLPFLKLDTITAQATLLADSALLNPRYHSWAPDGAALVFTAGGYRSAQVNKWLNRWDSTTNQVTTIISQTEQIPGIVAWSPQGDWIAYAAVPAQETGAEWADLMTFANPAIAGRRIYLLDPTTGAQHRLNDVDAFQDAPVWSEDGAKLYYVQRDDSEIMLMAADPTTGQATPIEITRQPLPDAVGYYGQGEWEQIRKEIPGSH